MFTTALILLPILTLYYLYLCLQDTRRYVKQLKRFSLYIEFCIFNRPHLIDNVSRMYEDSIEKDHRKRVFKLNPPDSSFFKNKTIYYQILAFEEQYPHFKEGDGRIIPLLKTGLDWGDLGL